MKAVLKFTTGAGVGARKHIREEVVHLMLAVVYEKIAIKESADPNSPWAYHASRVGALEKAQSLMKEIEGCGFTGQRVKLAIPGVPYPVGADFQGKDKNKNKIKIKPKNKIVYKKQKKRATKNLTRDCT